MVHLQPLQIIQNKAIRILGAFVHRPARLKNLSETQTLYIFLNILNLKQLKDVHTAMWYYDIQSSANYFHDLGITGTPTSPAHCIRSKKYRLPPFKSERARFSIRYQINVPKFHKSIFFEKTYFKNNPLPGCPDWLIVDFSMYFAVVFSRWGGLLYDLLPCMFFCLSFFPLFGIISMTRRSVFFSMHLHCPSLTRSTLCWGIILFLYIFNLN